MSRLCFMLRTGGSGRPEMCIGNLLSCDEIWSQPARSCVSDRTFLICHCGAGEFRFHSSGYRIARCYSVKGITERKTHMTSDNSAVNDSTVDQIKGKLHEAKGKIKEKAGQVTNNPDLEAEGQDENLSGKIQKKVGQIEKVFGS